MILRQDMPLTLDGQRPSRQFLITWNLLCQELEKIKENIAVQGALRPGVDVDLARTRDGLQATYADGVVQDIQVEQGLVTQVVETPVAGPAVTTNYEFDRDNNLVGAIYP